MKNSPVKWHMAVTVVTAANYDVTLTLMLTRNDKYQTSIARLPTYDKRMTECYNNNNNNMWKSSGCSGSTWFILSQERPRHQRHHYMNDILCRAIKRAQIPAVKEPTSLLQQYGKRPDGMGCNSSGHLCRVAHKPYSQGSRSSGQQSIRQQDSQIWSSVCLTHLCPCCSRDGRHMGASRPLNLSRRSANT